MTGPDRRSNYSPILFAERMQEDFPMFDKATRNLGLPVGEHRCPLKKSFAQLLSATVGLSSSVFHEKRSTAGQAGSGTRLIQQVVRHRRATIPRRRCLAVEPLESRLLLAGDSLVISELLAANDTGLADADGDRPDWIEIYNPTDEPVDLADWHLTDDEDNLQRWTFPSAVLASDDYLVVFASGKDRAADELHTNFKLGRGGEYLALVRPDGVTVEFAYQPEFPSQVVDVSYGLSADLESRGYFVTPTPGGPTVKVPSLELPPSLFASQVIINEILYHPAGDDTQFEFIELWNRGDTVVDVSDWRISDGVDFRFPDDAQIGAGEYLVIAADTMAFAERYGDVGVIGPWQGRLSNSGERIAIVDGDRRLVDEVTYFDEGDWANRNPDSDGWMWEDFHDGLGASLELVDPNRSNDYGQNWAANVRLRPSPGADNRVLLTSTAPLITQVKHDPASPTPEDAVTVTAQIVALPGEEVLASVHYRVYASGRSISRDFVSAEMRDDGRAGDQVAGDGVFSATIAPQLSGSIVEFYVSVEDGQGNQRSWPKFSRNFALSDPKLLYQVDDSSRVRPSDQLFHRLIFLRKDLEDFDLRSPNSNVETDATLVSTVDGVTEIRYNVGVRLRGNSSRGRDPKSYRINLPSDRPWQDRTAINIYGAGADRHLVGQASFEAAGLPNELARGVQLRINGENRATVGFPNTTPPALNGYVAFDAVGKDYLRRAFPDDSLGNLYRPGVGSTASLQLNFLGESADAYRSSYEKKSNETEDDWTDLIELTRAFNASETPDAVFSDVIAEVINVQQWLRVIAMDVFLFGNTDEFFLYRGTVDTRFVLIPHDLGPTFSRGAAGPILLDNASLLSRLVNDPVFLPFYYAHLKDLSETVFAAEFFEPMVDRLLGGWVPQSQITAIKRSAASRVAFVQSENPLNSPSQGYLRRFLRVTEVMYNPLPSSDLSDADFFEFVELRNTGDRVLDLTGVSLQGAIEFSFSDSEVTQLGPGEYVVLPSNWGKFIQRYGRSVRPPGQYAGLLADSGASFQLVTEDSLVIQVIEYHAQRPWPQQAAEGGISLEIIDTAGDYNDPKNWRASSETNGTPGRPGTGTTAGPPAVTRLTVAGSQWSDDLRRFIIDSGGKPSGVVVGTNDVLPWETIDLVSVTFNEDVVVAADDLVFDAEIETVAFEYDAGSFTATWMFDRPISTGAYRIELSETVVDRLGNQLASDFTSDVPFHFSILPGDANGDGQVNLRDVQRLRSAILAAARPGFPDIDLPPTFNRDYSLVVDFNTDGQVDVRDLTTLRAHLLESVLDERWDLDP